MAANPVVRMAAASMLCALGLQALFREGMAVLLGTGGPLAAALATWMLIERAHARSPAAVSGVMLRLFGAKMVLVPAYVAAVVLLSAVRPLAFVVSFTCQSILLYAIEALYLRRLFAGEGRGWSAG